MDENSGENQIIYTALARDLSPISYKIDDPSNFMINSETGVVRFVPDPDFEASESYEFTVNAIDEAGNIAEKTVRFLVRDVDDQAPVFISGGKANRLKEHTGAGQIVYTAEAEDDSNVAYRLEKSSDNDSDQFTIDPQSGNVKLVADPDYETISSYRFAISAIDQHNNVATRKVQLGIKNIDEPELSIDLPSDGGGLNGEDNVTGNVYLLKSRRTYKRNNADVITNFDILTERLQIESSGFDVQSSPVFDVASSKKRFNQLRRGDVDFIYRLSNNTSKPGLLYFNQNGPGRGLGKGGGLLAVLENTPALNTSLIDFV